MPAGRELDALVAEKVMGWTNVNPKEPYDLPVSGVAFGKGSPDGMSRGPIPYYSTILAAAWQVLETLRARGFLMVVSSPTPGRTLWDVRGWRPEQNDRRFIAHGETVELAICRAALEVMGK